MPPLHQEHRKKVHDVEHDPNTVQFHTAYLKCSVVPVLMYREGKGCMLTFGVYLLAHLEGGQGRHRPTKLIVPWPHPKSAQRPETCPRVRNRPLQHVPLHSKHLHDEQESCSCIVQILTLITHEHVISIVHSTTVWGTLLCSDPHAL